MKLVIHAYQQFDLLSCSSATKAVKDQNEPIIIDNLLDGPRKVLEYTMTFVNALASECLGRGYLL